MPERQTPSLILQRCIALRLTTFYVRYIVRRVESFITTFGRRVFRVVSRLGNRPSRTEIEFACERKATSFQVQVSSKSYRSTSTLTNASLLRNPRTRISLFLPFSFFFFFLLLFFFCCSSSRIARDNEQNASCISAADRPIEIQSRRGTLNVRVKNVADVLEESVGK